MRSRLGSKRARKVSPIQKRINKIKNFIQNLDVVIIGKSLLLILQVFILLFLAINLFHNYNLKKSFENNIINYANLNLETCFEIYDLTLFSSAYAEESEDGNGRIDISQFTDISFKIKNYQNKKIEQLVISDIAFSKNPSIGTPTLAYKNPLEFGKLTNFDVENVDEINFNVLNQDKNIDYSSPYILNNLSNPITLEYINKDVKTNYLISSNSLSYNGSLLKEAVINLVDLECSFSFDINIITSNNEEYICKVLIDIPLNQDGNNIYDGNITQKYDVNIYSFYRIK